MCFLGMYSDNYTFTFTCMENILHHFMKTWFASVTEFIVTEILKEHVHIYTDEQQEVCQASKRC